MISNISTKTGNLIDKGINRQFYRQEIAVMFKIVRFPKKLESFFDSLKNQFHWNHFEYFRTLVLLITISWVGGIFLPFIAILTAGASRTAAGSTTFSMSADAIPRSFYK